MITKQVVGDKLLAYLNGQLSLAALVAWAEASFVDATLAPDTDIELLNDILAYWAAADSPNFPLTWEICHQFLKQLGFTVKVVATLA
jgi:hypothetical protein